MSDKKDLGQLFRSTLQDYAPEPAEGGFAKVRSALQKSMRRRRLLRVGGATLVVVGLITAILLIQKPEQSVQVSEDISPTLPEVNDHASANPSGVAPDAQVSAVATTRSGNPAIHSEFSQPPASPGAVQPGGNTVPNPPTPGVIGIPASSGADSENAISSNQAANAVEANEIEERIPVSFSDDTTICFGGTAELSVFGGSTFQWSNGQSAATIKVEPRQSTTYSVLVKASDGQSYTGRIIVKVSDCANIFAPSGFTPNNDGLNDIFKISGHSVDAFSMRIFSRSGELVFESNDMDYGWNGEFGGRPAAEGAYIYVISYINRIGETVTKRGSVTLLR